MKKRIYQSLSLMIFVGSLLSISLYKPPMQLVNENEVKSFSGVFEKTNNYSNSVLSSFEESETNIVGEAINIDRLEMVGEIEVQSEPLVFPDSYYDPTTEEYREEVLGFAQRWADSEGLEPISVVFPKWGDTA